MRFYFQKFTNKDCITLKNNLIFEILVQIFIKINVSFVTVALVNKMMFQFKVTKFCLFPGCLHNGEQINDGHFLFWQPNINTNGPGTKFTIYSHFLDNTVFFKYLSKKLTPDSH